MMAFYLITNVGTLLHNPYAQAYPRHLVLAQVLMKHPECMKVLAHMRRNHFPRVILDNGAYEGELVSDDSYLRVIHELRPSVAVLPDIVGDTAHHSRQRSMVFADRLLEDARMRGRNMELMYVPQGKTKEENLEEYRWAIANLPPKQYVIGLGLSYRLWKNDPSEPNTETVRQRMVNAVAALPGFERSRFHLLGARWEFTREYGAHCNIQGVDTFKPCRMAIHGGSLEAAQEKPVGHGDVRSAEGLQQIVRGYCDNWGLYNGPDHFAPLPPHRKQRLDSKFY